MSHEIKSPLPGIFYRRSSPDAEPFVEVGSSLAEGDVIGLVEVMKSFHEIRADQAGTVSAISIENGDMVSAGQTLMELD